MLPTGMDWIKTLDPLKQVTFIDTLIDSSQ